MSMFKRNKKVNTKDKDKDKVQEDGYKIVIKERMGSTSRSVTEPFTAYRWRDETDSVIFLKNDKKKFLEVFPEDMRTFSPIEKAQVEKKIIQIKDTLKKEEFHDTEEINEKNLEFQLMKYEAIKRSFGFDSRSSYITFEDGRPTFYFMRDGSTFFPFKWDMDNKTIYVPSDNKKKVASLLLRNKEQKYSTAKFVEVTTLVLLFIAAFLLIAEIAGGYYLYKKYDDSNIHELETRSLKTLDVCSQYLLTNAKQIEQIAENVEKRTNPAPVELPPE